MSPGDRDSEGITERTLNSPKIFDHLRFSPQVEHFVVVKLYGL